jgi:hypothetical protein
MDDCRETASLAMTTRIQKRAVVIWLQPRQRRLITAQSAFSYSRRRVSSWLTFSILLVYLSMPLFIIIFYLIFFAIAILGAIFWIWMIVDCATNEPSDQGNDKVIWILVVILAGWIGAAIYYFVRRPERTRKFGK